MSPDRPDPSDDAPTDLPDYLATGLPAQDDGVLEATSEWLDAIVEYREDKRREQERKRIEEAELPDDSESIEDDSGGEGTLVKETVTCGKDNCKCADGDEHGPYVYLYKYVDGKLTSEYKGKPEDVEGVSQ